MKGYGHYVNKIEEGECYILDKRYASNRWELIRAYHILEDDLKELFEYIEPCDENLRSYSYRTYELLIRACTEIEANLKEILIANNYISPGSDLNMNDYFKIEEASKLSEYKIIINTWKDSTKIIQPFSNWSVNEYTPISWYRAYNNVKHNRNSLFREASLDNVINSIGGLYCILFSQFSFFVLDAYQKPVMFMDDGWISITGSLYGIQPPSHWNSDDFYGFDWNTIKNEVNPYLDYPFKKRMST